MSNLKLIVGLGNPGPSYVETRHNAGQWFVEDIARTHNIPLKTEAKFYGLTGVGNIHGQQVRLLIPTTFMNLSGKAVAALANFYKIAPEEILVAHDELDFPPGTLRVKKGGGHGGHNGLRDTIAALGNNKNFHRLRIGIGHPGSAKEVSNYVLKKAPPKEHEHIMATVDEAARYLPELLAGDWQKAMNHLHSFSAS
ncbi:Peptidyl-tRNA hydrolase [BD1-7 clade bacterium]|uniref:Peptidyl-tRNA hydrolase n=1 Tax=BD1-7 clade bacterium TaxID=2029982 RepID=A0A5S9MQT8_9GAMM|nr:Peptidyl-tRNA hydrolase [BD1-7 clade bacterium]CAA0084648.1 Peptidyl-tRNA hydrolase [BD1-7 clade bacterium]